MKIEGKIFEKAPNSNNHAVLTTLLLLALFCTLLLKVKRGNEPICEICRPKKGHKCSHAIVRDGLVFFV